MADEICIKLKYPKKEDMNETDIIKVFDALKKK
jgi:hypothetical protein